MPEFQLGQHFIQLLRGGEPIPDSLDERNFPFAWVIVEAHDANGILLVPTDLMDTAVHPHFDVLLPNDVPCERVARCGLSVWVTPEWLEKNARQNEGLLPLELVQQIRSACYHGTGIEEDLMSEAQAYDYHEHIDVVGWARDRIEEEIWTAERPSQPPQQSTLLADER